MIYIQSFQTMKIEYGYDIETCGAMFPDWFPIPETHNIYESSMMNEYKQFFEKYFNK